MADESGGEQPPPMATAAAEASSPPVEMSPASLLNTSGDPHDVLNALLQNDHTTETVDELSKSVDAFGTAEQAQTLLQTTMVRDLMRCIADNHKCIQAQCEALNFNRQEISNLRETVVGLSGQVDQQKAQLGSSDSAFADMTAQLAALRDQLAAMQNSMQAMAAAAAAAAGLPALPPIVMPTGPSEADLKALQDQLAALIERQRAQDDELAAAVARLSLAETAAADAAAAAAAASHTAAAAQAAAEGREAPPPAPAPAPAASAPAVDGASLEQLGEMEQELAQLTAQMSQLAEQRQGDSDALELERQRAQEREQQLEDAADASMAEVRERLDADSSRLVGEQQAQDKTLLELADENAKRIDELSSLRSELKMAMVAANAATDALAKLQNALDQLVAKPGDESGAGAMKAAAELEARMVVVEELLGPLTALASMKAEVAEHGSRLAELFTRKASKDDVAGLVSKVGGMNSQFSSELEKQARDIAAQLGEARDQLEGQLAGLGETVGSKADQAILGQLDRTVREEVERLANESSLKISKQTLEARLAELRSVLEKQLKGQVRLLPPLSCTLADACTTTTVPNHECLASWARQHQCLCMVHHSRTAGRRQQRLCRVPLPRMRSSTGQSCVSADGWPAPAHPHVAIWAKASWSAADMLQPLPALRVR